MTRTADILIVGAGMAGASLAAELAPHARVLLIEAEDQPGYHATGRSAAFWSECYGGPLVQPLTTASGAFLAAPPPEFHDGGFLKPRGALHLARAGDEERLHDLQAAFVGSTVPLLPVDRPELERRIPCLLSDWIAAVSEPSCADIDVAALHQAYLRAAKRVGAELITGARLLSAGRSGGTWEVDTSAGSISTSVLVNAAGAWADAVARSAGEKPIGIVPMRRTVVQLQTDPAPPSELPLVLDAAGTFYFKPEVGGRLWLSPHDETPCPAGDCAAEELDVALAIARFGEVVDWQVTAVERRWAGLRSFAPDRLPVYGWGAPNFFWFAGQGGFGIQTAPAAAKIAAALLLGRSPEPMLAHIDPAPYGPQRFPS